MIVFPDFVNITRHCDLDVGLMLSSEFCINTNYFCERLTRDFNREELSRLPLDRDAGDVESQALASSLRSFILIFRMPFVVNLM